MTSCVGLRQDMVYLQKHTAAAMALRAACSRVKIKDNTHLSVIDSEKQLKPLPPKFLRPGNIFMVQRHWACYARTRRPTRLMAGWNRIWWILLEYMPCAKSASRRCRPLSR